MDSSTANAKNRIDVRLPAKCNELWEQEKTLFRRGVTGVISRHQLTQQMSRSRQSNQFTTRHCGGNSVEIKDERFGQANAFSRGVAT